MPLSCSREVFIQAKSRSLIPVCCDHCSKSFVKAKNLLQRSEKLGWSLCCSRDCGNAIRRSNMVQLCCPECNSMFERATPVISRSNAKGIKLYFCSCKCNGKYYSQRRTTGTRRSRIERWMEERLSTTYPDLLIEFNQASTIGAELDIYIPSLALAFELNGPIHYQPIFGEDKFKRTVARDNHKKELCLRHNIKLCTIDVQKYKSRSLVSCEPYWTIIQNEIKQERKMERRAGISPT